MNTHARIARLFAFTPIAALVAVVGCGGDGEMNAAENHAQVASTSTATMRTTEAVAAQATLPDQAENLSGTVIEGALPPDITVSVPDSLALPGQSVEFTVLGTPDVSELVLYDGLNDRQAFVRESGSNVWHVTYRVPIHPLKERIGFSVTARNDADHWCRRWVFLRVASEAPASEPQVSPASEEDGSGTEEDGSGA